ncbi:MAG: Hsp20/alpha crystallin family protein [Candidatus Azobacteroides sp.]|nr:Hsp20/alpha crystallin family protein [Candidatus Azobacteroides sp.]
MKDLAKRNEYRRNFPAFMGSIFRNDFFNNLADSDMPAVNVKEGKDEYKIEVSAPGFRKEDFNLSIDHNVITISAKKEETNEEKDDQDKVLRQEFTSSSFSRSFTLPEDIDTEKISAAQNNGVLEIKLPKMEQAPEDQVKKIDIQ